MALPMYLVLTRAERGGFRAMTFIESGRRAPSLKVERGQGGWLSTGADRSIAELSLVACGGAAYGSL